MVLDSLLPARRRWYGPVRRSNPGLCPLGPRANSLLPDRAGGHWRRARLSHPSNGLRFLRRGCCAAPVASLPVKPRMVNDSPELELRPARLGLHLNQNKVGKRALNLLQPCTKSSSPYTDSHFPAEPAHALG